MHSETHAIILSTNTWLKQSRWKEWLASDATSTSEGRKMVLRENINTVSIGTCRCITWWLYWVLLAHVWLFVVCLYLPPTSQSQHIWPASTSTLTWMLQVGEMRSARAGPGS